METPQAVKTLHPELTVMEGSHNPKDISPSDKKSIESPQAPHHSHVCIENQRDPQISHPPSESNDPIAYALEESYVASHVAKQKFSSF